MDSPVMVNGEWPEFDQLVLERLEKTDSTGVVPVPKRTGIETKMKRS